jgi:hypothetical protein
MREMRWALNNAVRRWGSVQEAHAVRWYAVSDSWSSLAHGFTRADSVGGVQSPNEAFCSIGSIIQRVSFISLSWAPQATQEDLADEGLLCNQNCHPRGNNKKTAIHLCHKCINPPRKKKCKYFSIQLSPTFGKALLFGRFPDFVRLSFW